MTHEEAIDVIQARLAALAKFTADVTMDIGRELDALRQPQETKMSRAQAIATAGQLWDEAWSERNADFHYDRKSRKTTCVIRIKPTRKGDRATYAVGRAWCSRYDQSVAVVGYAIAYLRALGREVPAWLLHIPQE